MKNNLNVNFARLRLIVVLMGVTLPILFQPYDAKTYDGLNYLFVQTNQDLSERFINDVEQDPAVVRFRPVGLNFDLLFSSDGTPHDLDGSTEPFFLNLFDDVLLEAAFDQVQAEEFGGYVFSGHLVDYPSDQILLTIVDEIAIGKVWAGGKQYQLRYDQDGIHAVLEVDPSQYPAENPYLEVQPPPDEVNLSGDAVPMGDSGSQIDIMVVYTPAARAGAGGVAQMNAIINQSIVETNLAFTNSLINSSVYLVHTAEINYIESGDMYTDIYRLQRSSDGYFDNIHVLRDMYSADVVTLITETGGCGLGFLQTFINHSFQAYAFNVISRPCASGNLTFPHELGHNMGARHDWYVDDSKTPYTYSHGYSNTTAATKFRTIMSYPNLCSAKGVSCSRITYFSNPNVNYSGTPTGIAGGTDVTCVEGNSSNTDCDADNALTLNNTFLNTANFRDSTCAAPGKPALKKPNNKAVKNIRQLNLDWTDALVSGTYQVQFDNNANFSSPAYDNFQIYGSEFDASAKVGPGTYYWRVRAHNYGNGCYKYGAWSAVRKIKVTSTRLFADGFEKGNLGAWNKKVGKDLDAAFADLGKCKLCVDTTARMIGDFGLNVHFLNKKPHYLQDDFRKKLSRYRARFYFNPASLAMKKGNKFNLFQGQTGAAQPYKIQVRIKKGLFQLRGVIRNDSGSQLNTKWIPLPNWAVPIEMDWKAAASQNNPDGHLKLWVNGVLAAKRTDIDNDTLKLRSVRLGIASSIKKSYKITGSFFLDGFDSDKKFYIGP